MVVKIFVTVAVLQVNLVARSSWPELSQSFIKVRNNWSIRGINWTVQSEWYWSSNLERSASKNRTVAASGNPEKYWTLWGLDEIWWNLMKSDEIWVFPSFQANRDGPAALPYWQSCNPKPWSCSLGWSSCAYFKKGKRENDHHYLSSS